MHTSVDTGLFKVDLEPGFEKLNSRSEPGFQNLDSRPEPGFEKLNSRFELEMSKKAIIN